MNLDELKNRFRRGERFHFMHFWGHRTGAGCPVTASCLSQWFPAAFVVEGVRYPTRPLRWDTDDIALHETLEQAALRELEEETGLRLAHAEQLRAFDGVNRDPRERVISIAHMAVVHVADHAPKGSDDASEAAWFDLNALPPLAFDHDEVLAFARKRLSLTKN